MKGRAADLPFHRKSRIFVTGAYALIMAGVLYYALFGSAASLSGGSPLYTDLSSCAAYARNGFDPDEIAAIPALKSEPDLEPAPGGWQIFRLAGDPAGMRRIMNSGLPGLPRRAFMSPFGAKAQEFTILFEVEIGADKIAYLDADPSRVPGISLAGIGENWQIFLNGRLVRSEMHLDQDGRILVGKSMRDVIFPVDRALLAEGTNILAFRIVGDPTYDSTGFIYSRPYYIDEYQDIEKHHDASLLYALCGIYFFIGVYHLMLFLGQKRDFANLYHSIFTIMLGAYTIIRTSLIYSLIQDTGVATRIELAVLFASIPAVGAFVESLAQLRPTLVSKLYYGFCLLMVASVSALPLPFSDDALYVWNLVSLAYILRVVISVAARSLLRETRRGWDERRAAGLAEPLWRANVRAFLTTPLGNNAIALGFMVFCAIFDVIDVIFIANSYGLFRYGFFVFVSISAYGLAERFDRLLMQLDASNTALDEANTMLEATVVDRTRELELKAAELERQARELEVQALAAQEASEAAQLASKAKSEFLAHMSHEIRTPMNAILGMLELIQRKELAPDVREDTMIIKNAGRSLLSIINDILDFSKIESGRLEIVPARYSLASLLNDVVSIIRVRLVDKPLFFIVDLDSRLPASLVGDEARLRQILINLLSNALKYTREGHFSLRVGGGARDDGARSGGAGGSSAGGSGAGSGDGESGGAWGSGAGRGDVDGSSAWGSGPKSSGAGGDGVDSNNADGGARSSDAGGSGADDSDTGSCGGESGGAWGNGAFELRLEVSDTGVGIRDEDIGRLFQDFTQLDLAKHKSVEGTGLGLAITRSLCAAMGGSISVESEYGKGSRFTATLPQTPEGTDVLAAVRAPGRKGVLVFERQRACADSIAGSLRSLGVRHRVASTREEFASALAEAAAGANGGTSGGAAGMAAGAAAGATAGGAAGMAAGAVAGVTAGGATDPVAGSAAGGTSGGAAGMAAGAAAGATAGGAAEPVAGSAAGETSGGVADTAAGMAGGSASAAATADESAGSVADTAMGAATGAVSGAALYTHVFVSAALADEARQAIAALFGGDGDDSDASYDDGDGDSDVNGDGGDGDSAGRRSDARRPSLVTLLGPGDSAARNVGGDVLDMPAHAVSIANLLNGSDGFSARQEDGENEGGQQQPRFTAPDAKALVVDDISTNLLVMEGLLEPYEIMTDTCLSGKEAIRLALANRYDIIFMDHMMPEMDGIEAAAAIRALDAAAGAGAGAAAGELRYADLPIVVLTANAVVGQREMFMQSGFSDFLAKPIELHKLNAALHRWLPAEKKVTRDRNADASRQQQRQQ